MFLQAKTGVTLHRRVFDWFRKNSEKKEIGVKVCVSNNKALVSYSSSVTDWLWDSWGSVHKKHKPSAYFPWAWADTSRVLWSFSIPISWIRQQLSLSFLCSLLEWVRSSKGKKNKKKNFGSACGIIWKLKPQATLWSLESHFTAQIADGRVCEGIKDGGGGGRRRKEWMRERENRLWRGKKNMREGERGLKERKRKGREREEEREKSIWLICFLLAIQIFSPDTLVPQNYADKGGKIQGNLKSQTTVCTPLHVKEKGVGGKKEKEKSPSGFRE